MIKSKHGGLYTWTVLNVHTDLTDKRVHYNLCSGSISGQSIQTTEKYSSVIQTQIPIDCKKVWKNKERKKGGAREIVRDWMKEKEWKKKREIDRDN